MTKIIGHRGAAGLELENSTESIRAALCANVDAVELDVRRTRDNKLVAMHDATTARVARQEITVAETSLDELRHVQLNNGQPIATLDELLEIMGSKPVIIELKDSGAAGEFLRTLARHPTARASCASFKYNELLAVKQRRPDIPLYILEHYSPIEIIYNARRLGARGIGLNKWLMNPLTYRLAKRYGLELYVYTVNNRALGKFLTLLYPGIHICTDFPQRFVKARGK